MCAMRLAAVTLLALPLLLLTACSSPSPEAAAPAEPASTSAAPRATKAAAAPADAVCHDKAGDGGGFDIRSVRLDRVGAQERVTMIVARVPAFPSHSSASVIVSFFDKTGNDGGMFSTWWKGQKIETSSVDDDATHLEHSSTRPVINGKTITTTYPADAIDRLAGRNWIWTVTTTLDGNDVDTCSNAAWDASTN